MFGRRFPLFRLFGFEVRADIGWIIIAVFVTWSLALGAFPSLYVGLSPAMYWLMGLVGALGLFASILLHEVSHAAVARRDGLETRWITLWIFGGVAETVAEPSTAASELRVALAGPLCSLLIGAVCILAGLTGERMALPVPVTGVLAYLGWINILLAIFNLLPGFPLDGGRVFRALLWRATGDLDRATRTATRAGIAIGILLMAAGVFFVIGGNLVGGVWWVLIGSFLRRAADVSQRQAVLRRVLAAVPVHRIMDRNPPVVPLGERLDAFVHDYAYTRGRMRFPVLDGDALVGFIDVEDVRRVPVGEWSRRTVAELVRPLGPEVVIAPEADGAEALRRLQDGDTSMLIVAEGTHLEGVISLDDLLRSMRVRGALEGGRTLETLRPQQPRP
jgi:Zn-dependent protease